MDYLYLGIYMLPWILGLSGLFFAMYSNKETKAEHVFKYAFFLSYFSFFIGALIFNFLGKKVLAIICAFMVPGSILILGIISFILSKSKYSIKYERSFRNLLEKGIWAKAKIVDEIPDESYPNTYKLVLEYNYNGEKKECKTIKTYNKKQIEHYKSFKYGVGIKVFDNICNIEEKEPANLNKYQEYSNCEKKTKKVAYISEKHSHHISNLLIKSAKILIVLQVIIPIIIVIIILINR